MTIDLEAIRAEIADADRCVYNLRAMADRVRDAGMYARLLPSEILSVETSASELQRAKEHINALLAEVERKGMRLFTITMENIKLRAEVERLQTEIERHRKIWEYIDCFMERYHDAKR